jgi:ABC-type multidrug transport system ATPase subunit
MKSSCPGLLAIDSLTFRRRAHVVLREVNLEFNPGLNIILGPNGSGKSTLLSLAATETRDSLHAIAYDGLAPKSARDYALVRRGIGWLPQDNMFDPTMTLRQFVSYIAWLRAVDDANVANFVEEAIEAVEMTERADDKIRKLSGGMKRRAVLASAIVNKPQFLFLDEPAAGLDPHQRTVFNRVVRQLAADGTTVVAATHLVEDAKDADTLTVLSEGSVAASLSMSEVIQSYNGIGEAYEALVGV